MQQEAEDIEASNIIETNINEKYLMMKSSIKYCMLAVVFLLCGAAVNVAYGQSKKFSVLGDSYSTFEGLISPSSNACWYFNGRTAGRSNDVKSSEQTWWKIFESQSGYALDVNNSYSGATICCTGYRKEDYSDRSFISRMFNLGKPELILVFGGTNDSWSKAPIGEYMYDGWTKSDLYSYRPALSYMLSQMKVLYPQSRIVFILNSELSDAIDASTNEICAHYGIEVLELHDIDKIDGHPSVAGMKQIAEQILVYLKK